MTTDGGNTWTLYPLDPSFNRFRRVSETIAYISGESVWKYTMLPVGQSNIHYEKPGYRLEQNIPNPFTDKTAITYTLPEKGRVTLKIFDAGGRTIQTMVNQNQEPGTYTYLIEIPNLGDAKFFCKLSVNGFKKVIKMTMVKE